MLLYERGWSVAAIAEVLLLSEDAIREHITDRPYLQNYPFQPPNIEIRIFLQDANGLNFGKENLCVISAIEGVLKYKIENLEGQLETIHEESYEEALRELEKLHSESSTA